MGNLTRIIGGVIAAGAVAAGASAFTAPGVEADSSLAGGVTGGGSISVTVNGLAIVKSARVVQPLLSPNEITGVSAEITAPNGSSTVAAGSTVLARVTGTGGTEGASKPVSDWITCTQILTGTNYSCVVGANKYYNALSKIEIAVVAANSQMPTS
ncbi:hypothetical protein [Paractinoplanes lichenicola]|uniref:Uncharacterized protein n=1 Tax=Paractinoplanes lichenicola TaxID=2802976 RepID=A0ABS1VJW3_9ACTN|nr:hypothetical protein [Actinoplanes lichenicola]MBL7254996.1 hypothetical protein [Actinoplanes lichenicola]